MGSNKKVVNFLALVTMSAASAAIVGCSSICTCDRAVTLKREVVDASKEPFRSHGNYLSMVVPYEPVKAAYEQVQKRTGLKLITRGEAHITVVTPPEFEALRKKVTMAEIDAIASREKMQESDLDPVCVGEGLVKEGDHENKTYFIVVRSSRLKKVREEIAALFQKRGGDKKAFIAAEFYPHVTVGFTATDLHIEQGVVKDEKSCRFALLME